MTLQDTLKEMNNIELLEIINQYEKEIAVLKRSKDHLLDTVINIQLSYSNSRKTLDDEMHRALFRCFIDAGKNSGDDK